VQWIVYAVWDNSAGKISWDGSNETLECCVSHSKYVQLGSTATELHGNCIVPIMIIIISYIAQVSFRRWRRWNGHHRNNATYMMPIVSLLTCTCTCMIMDNQAQCFLTSISFQWLSKAFFKPLMDVESTTCCRRLFQSFTTRFKIDWKLHNVDHISNKFTYSGGYVLIIGSRSF